jgi:glycosyltransferase involved in cell wall biosynthesis
MRVLLLSQFYAPVVGGVERVVEDVARALVRRGHEVSVATLSIGTPTELDGVSVYRLRTSTQRLPGIHREPDRPHAPPAPDPEAVFALRRIVARVRPDVVHAHDWLVHSYLPLRKLGGPSLVLSLHDHSLVCATRRLFRHGTPCTGPALFKCLECAGARYGFLRGAALVGLTRVGDRTLRSSVDMFLPVSESVVRAAGLRGPRAVPFQVIPNFVSADLTDRAARADAGVELPPEFLLYVGDATQDKGIDTLLDAHATLSSSPPLVVLGRRYSEGLRTPRSDVRSLGARNHEGALALIRRSLITIVPSLVPETFGMVALEAMALGRPIVASRVGGLAELLRDGETALLVRPGDSEELRDALVRLLEQPSERQRLATAAELDAERFAERSIVPRLEDAYRAAIVARSSAEGGEPGRAVPA